MNLQELSNLDDLQLTHLLLTYDNWRFDEEKKQIFTLYNDTNIIFNLNEFSPFSKPFQAEMILKMSSLDFSLIQSNDNVVWGLSVFEDKNKKYLILESPSKLKSSLLLLIAVNCGLLQN